MARVVDKVVSCAVHGTQTSGAAVKPVHSEVWHEGTAMGQTRLWLPRLDLQLWCNTDWLLERIYTIYGH
jgi:hypothetical protein